MAVNHEDEYSEDDEQAANEGNSFGRVGLGRFDMGHPIRHVLGGIEFNRAAAAACFGAGVPSPERSGRVAAEETKSTAGGNCTCC